MIPLSRLDLVRRGDASTAELHNQSKLALLRMRGVGPARQVMPNPIPEAGDSDTVARSVAVTAIEEDMLITRGIKRHMVEVEPPVDPPVTVWDGRWEFTGDEVSMHPWPLVEADEYTPFIAGLDAADLIEEDDHILSAHKYGDMWFVTMPAGAGNIEKFRVMNDIEFPAEGERAMQNDYFYAEHVSTGEKMIKVAKPYKLRTTPWHDTTEWLTEFEVKVTYIYPRRFEPSNFNYRWATREDEPNIRAVQIVWPAYGTDSHTFTARDFVWAAFVGEAATGIDSVDWQDMNVDGRVWSLFPAAFQAQR